MKKSIVLLAIAVVLVGLVAAFNFYVSEDPYEDEQNEGEALMEMENEAARQVQNMRNEIESDSMSLEDCRIQITEMVTAILTELSNVGELEKSYINVAYNCNMIRQMGLLMEDRENMTEAELELKNDNLVRFANAVFAYCLDVSNNTEEKEDYQTISEWADDIEENLDQEIERYTEKMYSWYASQK